MKKLMLSLLVLLCGTAFAQNHWTPNTDPYEDYMAMIVVVQLDGEEQASTTLEIGAFCADECRGSAFAAYFPPTDRYLYQLPVYGNTGDVITFKLYDHGQELELEGLEVAEAVLTEEGYGSLGNPYIMSFTTVIPPTGVPIELTPGWNWISYLLENPMPLVEALAGLVPEEGDMIKSQSGNSTFVNGQWNGTLTTLMPGRGLIYMNNSNQTKVFYYPKENH